MLTGFQQKYSKNNSPSLLALQPAAHFFISTSLYHSLWTHLSLLTFISSYSASSSSHFFFLNFLLSSLFHPSHCVPTPPHVLSLLAAPEAMWSKRGSRVTEAGPFGVTSSLSHLRSDGVHVHGVCAWGGEALFSRAQRGVRG